MTIIGDTTDSTIDAIDDVIVVGPDEWEDDFDRRNALITAATADISFQLHYRRCETKRVFDISGLSGPLIDNAFDAPDERTMAPGDWSNGDMAFGNLDAERVRKTCFSTAINESVHEALEWFQINGTAALNPHGQHEIAIFEAVGELVNKLWALRYDQPTHTFCTHVVPVRQGAVEPVHIRAVAPDGLRRRNGHLDGEQALCGQTIAYGWDLHEEVTRTSASKRDVPDDGDSEEGRHLLCRRCQGVYLALGPA